jgi:hypothetical protein
MYYVMLKFTAVTGCIAFQIGHNSSVNGEFEAGGYTIVASYYKSDRTII